MTTDLERLIKAVWAAGFRVGSRNGADCATAFEWGERSRLAQNPEAAWKEEIQPLIESEWDPMDITSPDAWESKYL